MQQSSVSLKEHLPLLMECLRELFIKGLPQPCLELIFATGWMLFFLLRFIEWAGRHGIRLVAVLYFREQLKDFLLDRGLGGDSGQGGADGTE